MIVAVPAAGAVAVRAVRRCTRSSRAPATASTTGTGSSRSTEFVGLDNFREASRRPAVPRRDAAQRHHHRAVAAAADPVRARSGGAAQLRSSAAGPCCARCSSPRTSSPRSSPASCGARSCARTGCSTRSSTSVGAGGLVQEWLADPDVVLYSLFFVISWKYFGFHMVILLAGLQQIPKELGEAAAIDGASSWQTLPLRHAAPARPDAAGVDLPVDHRRPAAVRPRLGHHQGRPDRRVVDDGDVPLRPVPQGPVRLRQRRVDRDLRALARRRARSTSGSRCDATSEGLVSLAELDDLACSRPTARRAPRRPTARSLRRRPRACSAIVVIPLLFSVLGGFRDNDQLVTEPVGLPDPWVTTNYTQHPASRHVLAPGVATAR